MPNPEYRNFERGAVAQIEPSAMVDSRLTQPIFSLRELIGAEVPVYAWLWMVGRHPFVATKVQKRLFGQVPKIHQRPFMQTGLLLRDQELGVLLERRFGRGCVLQLEDHAWVDEASVLSKRPEILLVGELTLTTISSTLNRREGRFRIRDITFPA